MNEGRICFSRMNDGHVWAVAHLHPLHCKVLSVSYGFSPAVPALPSQDKEAYLQGQIGNPDGEEKPNKKFYDPRVWIRKVSEMNCVYRTHESA